MLLLAFALAMASVVMARSWLAEEPSPAAQKARAATTTVVVAARDLGYGDRLAREDLREAERSVEVAAEGTFRAIDDIFEDGRGDPIVLERIRADEPVLAGKVSGFGRSAPLSMSLADDKRAFTLRVNDVAGVAGFLVPGDRVDVLLTRKKDGSKGLVTNIVLQDVKVLGVDQITDNDKNKPAVARTVTVEVTPLQAQKLALSNRIGSITLALRNTFSPNRSTQQSVGIKDLVLGEHSPSAPAETSPQHAVTVVRGAKVSVEKFPSR